MEAELKAMEAGAGEEKYIDELRAIIDLVSKALMKRKAYFYWYMLHKLPIYYEPAPGIASSDSSGIYLKSGFIQLPLRESVFTIMHEIQHIVGRHSEVTESIMRRARSVYERNAADIAANIIADAVVNSILAIEEGDVAKRGYVDPDAVARVIEGDPRKLGFQNSMEKFLLMVRRGDIEVSAVDKNGSPIDLSSRPLAEVGAGKILAEVMNRRNGSRIKVLIELHVGGGHGSGRGGDGDRESREQSRERRGGGQKSEGSGGCSRCVLVKPGRDRAWSGGRTASSSDIERLAREATDFHREMQQHDKSAGRGVVEGIDYDLEDISAKKPEWEAKLVGALTRFLSRYAVVSWRFINRRAPMVKPGVRYITIPRINILLDVSGSMLDGSLEKALERVVYIAENYDSEIILYKWSGGASPPEKIDKKFAADLKRKKKINIDTGGTEIKPALKLLLENGVTQDDMVVVLTDGYIYDIDSTDVQELFSKVANRAGQVVFASLGYIPENLPRRVERVKIEEREA